MKPSQMPAVQRYTAVRQMFHDHLDMQFDDVRAMLRLPTGGLPGGCNFAAASVLTNLLSGFSVVLYDPPSLPARGRVSRGARFRHLMKRHFPWDSRVEPAKTRLVEVIYDFSRNSLTHVLGLREPARGEPEIALGKRPLTVAEIGELDKKRGRPGWLGPTVKDMGGSYRLSVPALYWGTVRVLEILVSSKRHMTFAEQALRKGKWVP